MTFMIKPLHTVNQAARLLGSKGGKASAGALTQAQRKERASNAGKALAAMSTPKQRKARAVKAAKARWAKVADK
jgi:general stress protein YciG